MSRAQFNLDLPDEAFALVGEKERAPDCEGCGARSLLIGGYCERCLAETERDLIESEARQRNFFGD